MFTVVETPEFTKWLFGLKDGLTRRRLATRLRKISLGNFGDIKPVASGIYEMREHFGPGWRMYFIKKDNFIVVMLSGGDKSSQQNDIEKAIKLANELKSE